MLIPKEYRAIAVTALLIAGVFLLGLHMLSLPAITLFRQWPYYLLPRPEIVLGMAALMACFHAWVAQGVSWAAMKLHRWMSAVLTLIALGADGLLHVFSIPHMEGWWLSVLGSGFLMSAISAWLQRLRERLHP